MQGQDAQVSSGLQAQMEKRSEELWLLLPSVSIRARDRQLPWIQRWAAPAFPGTGSPFDALVPEAPLKTHVFLI